LKQRDEGALTHGSVTLAAFVDEYISAAKSRNVRPRTIEAYREKLEKHVVPTLGRIRLDKLTSAQVQTLYGNRLDAGLSPSTICMVHQVLHSLMKLAKRRKLVGYVVTDDVDPPKRAKYQAHPLTVIEARAVLKGIRDHRHGSLWTFILGTGCRFGEAAGLTWADVDLSEGLATIRQQVTRERQDGHVRLTIRPVKTDAGNRQAPLAPWIVTALRAQRARIAEMRLVAGQRWTDQDLVFPGRHGGPLAENHVLVTWHRALDRIKLPDGKGVPRIRMHDLRHTKASLMIDEGEELVVVQRTLGHAHQSITADLYVGKVPKALRRAADRFGELLDPDQQAAV
jgi:integrase